jgi:antitoxin component YwqK of YwqJK toxin-antitoxin module
MNINPFNKKHEPHGYWKQYWSNNILWSEGNYTNGKENGLHLFYNYDNNITLKEYHIN